jgi:potassium-transporting ATPase KdpC subunit
MFQRIIRPAIMMMIVMTVITGVIYPLAVTAIAQLVFPRQAGGSLIYDGEKLVGSSLIGQPIDAPELFWGRPSATGPYPYNAANSSGSNQGPLEPALLAAVKGRVEALKQADPGNDKSIPVDLVTASSSGLDPHISPAAADYQVPRVAKARGLDEKVVRGLVAKHTQLRTLGMLGEPRVNVLELNLALNGTKP